MPFYRNTKETLSPTGRGYQSRIAIDNTGNATTLTDYQVKVTITYRAHMDRSFNDIRFYSDSDGHVPLPYWNELIIEGEKAIAWDKVPSITGSSTKYIYMRYGQGKTESVINDVAAMIAGSDFNDGTTTGWTINTASSGTATVPTITADELVGIRVQSSSKYFSNPVIPLGAGGTWDDVQVRDMAIVIDGNGYPVVESDGLWAYYGGYDGAVWAIGLAKSTDNGYTWTKYVSNPVISASGVGSRWDEDAVYQPTVIKEHGVWYMMLRGETGASNAIGVYTSSDGLSWSEDAVKLVLGDFLYDSGPTAISEMGVPCMIKRKSGDYLVVFEGLKTGSVASEWAIFGATAPTITGAWTPLNGGLPLFGATTGWENDGVANAHIIQVESGDYLIAYNGYDYTVGQRKWEIGFASSSDLTSWTRYTGNPVIKVGANGAWDDIHAECSFLVKEENSSLLRLYYQGFATSTTCQIGLATFIQTRFLHGVSSATSDGWIIGVDLDGTSDFSYEAILQNGPGSPGTGSTVYFSILDQATVPSPNAVATIFPTSRIWIERQEPNGSQPGKFVISYNNTGGTTYYWNGSSWVTTPITYYYGVGIYKVKIWDDGTNFNANVYRWPGETSLINTAVIAKATVKAFSSGRVATFGEIFTNAYYIAQRVDNLFVRKSTSVEPSATVGGEVEI